MISFDIDDTIQDSGIDKIEGYLGGGVKMPDTAVAKFRELKEIGFTLALLSNTSESIVSDTCKQLGAYYGQKKARALAPQGFQRFNLPLVLKKYTNLILQSFEKVIKLVPYPFCGRGIVFNAPLINRIQYRPQCLTSF